MADNPGKDTPSTDPKAQGRTGPVKPPVLEGTARSAAGSKPAGTASGDKPSNTNAERKEPPAPMRSAIRPDETEAKAGTTWLAGIIGGLLGLAAAYGLAFFGLWPAPPQTEPPADPRLSQVANAIPELETIANTTQDELATLTARVGELEAGIAALPSGPAADSGLAENLAAHSARLDALEASPETPADTGAIDDNAQAISVLETELSGVRNELNDAAAQLAEARDRIAALTADAGEDGNDLAGLVRLPLIFSGLESAFAAGRPFETELAALRQARPEIIVPEPIAGRAAAGLPRPDDVQQRLNAALPAILAGRPADADASWQDATADWFRTIIAMRPAGAVEGVGPDAIVARLEAAVARRDFAAAQAELAALPQPMREAAGPVADDITALAGAGAFLAQLHAQALGMEAGT